MEKLKKSKLIHTIRWKFIYVIFISILLCIASVTLGYLVYSKLIYINLFRPAMSWVVDTIGSTPVMWVTGILLFLFYFFILSRRVIMPLDNITAGLQEIAKGNLDYKIAITSSDELGIMADRINKMVQQLKMRLEEELEKLMEEERKVEKTKNELITGVSHDLRTPLTSIIGYLELIEEDHYKDEVEFRYYSNIAYSKALRLKKLIDDLFEYTSIDDKGPLLKMERLNLNGLLNQLAEEFTPVLEKKGMSYRMLAIDKTLYIEADGNLLVRAYENLITNAIRYGSEGKNVDIRISSENDEAVVEVINYGTEIPERDLPYIFDRFYRTDKSRSLESGGSGLGLAITKSIVELNGGKISARSDRKQTVFETRFPIALKS